MDQTARHTKVETDPFASLSAKKKAYILYQQLNAVRGKVGPKLPESPKLKVLNASSAVTAAQVEAKKLRCSNCGGVVEDSSQRLCPPCHDKWNTIQTAIKQKTKRDELAPKSKKADSSPKKDDSSVTAKKVENHSKTSARPQPAQRPGTSAQKSKMPLVMNLLRQRKTQIIVGMVGLAIVITIAVEINYFF